ncbi:hypothetical protein GCM10020001_083220 [Nonomuraea salmonea]
MFAVHAGVDDADEDLLAAGDLGVGAVGADHAHVPLAGGERFAGPLGERLLVGECSRDGLRCRTPDAAVGADPDDGGVAAHGRLEGAVAPGGEEVAELGVVGDGGAAGAFDGGLGLTPAAVLVEDEVFGLSLALRGGFAGGLAGLGGGGGAGREGDRGGQRRHARGEPPHSSPPTPECRRI